MLVEYKPHPLTIEGRRLIAARPGQAVRELVKADERSCRVIVNGELSDFSHEIGEGEVVRVEAVVRNGGDDGGSNPIAAVLSIAVLVAAPYLAGKLAGRWFAAGAAAWKTAALTGVIGFAGILVVNSLFPPRPPKLPGRLGREAGEVPRLYSIAGGSNQARLYEPLMLVLGTHRVFPDLAAQDYTEYDQSGDQFLNQLFDFGIGELRVSDLRIGETELSDYTEAQTQRGPAIDLVAGNVDTLQGGDFSEDDLSIQRSTKPDTVFIAFDLIAQHFRATDSGDLAGRAATFALEWKVKDSSSAWTTRTVTLNTPSGAQARVPVRRSYKYAVSSGAYDARVRLTSTWDADDERVTFNASLAGIRAFQPQTADFSGRNPLALRIKATGQLYGTVQSLNAEASQLIEDWDADTSAWVAGQATSNPASILYKYLRGWQRSDGRTIAGMGLPESRIDRDSIQRWHEFCDENGLECNLVVQDGRDHNALMTLICQCGWASLDTQSGKWGVLWEDETSLISALITPASVVAGTMQVTYDNEGLADELVGDFIDRDSGYETNQLRRTMPGVSVPTRPSDVVLEGITSGEQAAKELNRAAAAQAYHIRTISWEMDLEEAAGIARGDVVGISHGLIGNGTGGRLEKFHRRYRSVAYPWPRLESTFSEDGYLWIWDLNGDVRSYRCTGAVEFPDEPGIGYNFAGNVPGPPAGVEDTPSAYRYMYFHNTRDSDAIDSQRVRITGKEPAGFNRIRLTARDENNLYYDHRTSDLTWTPLELDATGSEHQKLRQVSSLSVDIDRNGLRTFNWTAHESPEVTRYQLRYGSDRQWDGMTALHEGFLTATTFEKPDIPPEGEFYVAVAGFDRAGMRTEVRYLRKTFTHEFVGGQRWLNGAGAPASSLGEDGDYYIDTDDGTVYENVDGTWGIVANLGGADGATWHSGDGAPASSLGKDGDFYLRTGAGAVAGTIYRKTSGAWVLQVDIDNGADGATWHSGDGAPANDLGKVGDFYLRTSNGFVYEKTAAETWTFRRDITGPRGIQGPKGDPGDAADRRGAAVFSVLLNAAQTAIWVTLNYSSGSRIADTRITNLLNAAVGGTALSNDWVQIQFSARTTTAIPYPGVPTRSTDFVSFDYQSILQWQETVGQELWRRTQATSAGGTVPPLPPDTLIVTASTGDTDDLAGWGKIRYDSDIQGIDQPTAAWPYLWRATRTVSRQAAGSGRADTVDSDWYLTLVAVHSSANTAYTVNIRPPNAVWATWDATGRQWRLADRDFLAAGRIQAVDISAIRGNFSDLDVSGVLSARYVDADNLRSWYLLWSGKSVLVNHERKFFDLNDSLDNYDWLGGVLESAGEGVWGVRIRNMVQGTDTPFNKAGGTGRRDDEVTRLNVRRESNRRISMIRRWAGDTGNFTEIWGIRQPRETVPDIPRPAL